MMERKGKAISDVLADGVFFLPRGWDSYWLG